MHGMHALPPDCLAVPLVSSRSSAPPPVQLGIELDVVVSAYAETQGAYNIYRDGLRTRLDRSSRAACGVYDLLCQGLGMKIGL